MVQHSDCEISDWHTEIPSGVQFPLKEGLTLSWRSERGWEQLVRDFLHFLLVYALGIGGRGRRVRRLDGHRGCFGNERFERVNLFEHVEVTMITRLESRKRLP